MTRREEGHLLLRTTRFLAVALIAIGCNSPNVRANAEAGPPPVTLALQAGDPATDTIRQQLAALPLGQKHTRKRKGMNCNCANDVSIQSIGQTRDIRPDDGPVPARLVAFIQNEDLSRPTDKPRFKPKSQAVYYVQVSRDPTTSRAKWRFLEFPAAGGAAITVSDSGWVHGCGHPPYLYDDADFQDCDGHHFTDSTGMVAAIPMQRPGLLRAALLNRTFFMPLVAEDPTWISCNAGCCTLAAFM